MKITTVTALIQQHYQASRVDEPHGHRHTRIYTHGEGEQLEKKIQRAAEPLSSTK